MRLGAVLGVCGLCVVAGGCAGLGAGTAPGEQDAGEDAVAQQLAQAAGRAEAALGRLSRIEATRDPIDWQEPPDMVPEALMREVSLDWTGPLAGLAQRLAELSGYEYEETGARPVQPVIVDVHSVERPLIAVLREAGFQGGPRVKLVVDARRRVVEVVHRGW